MKPATADADNWREKYFANLNRAEEERRRFQSLEAALKRIAGRLCTASLGQSRALDEQIRNLQAALRSDASGEEFDEITPALTEAIRSLDDSAHPGAQASPEAMASVSFDDERIHTILATLFTELRRDAELAPEVDKLSESLKSSLTREQLPEVFASVTNLVNERIRRIEHARHEIEVLLRHMVGKLDEINRFVSEQHASQNESQASSQTLSVRLVDEMKAMGASVDAADDLQQMRVQVRSRLDSIDRHLQEFREREAVLAAAMRARGEQMQARITELEARARRLHHRLKDEQRLSTIDALTRIPNRMAYEKRIDEEFKRWQRFRQPTCIAVWDVDHFKRINDGYGHRAGDKVLRTVARTLAGRLRATDFVARYGGEEFVMILPGTGPEDGLRVIEELRTAIANLGFHFRGTPVSITISIGVTAFQAADSAGAAFDRADKALYRAKESGRNRCVTA